MVSVLFFSSCQKDDLNDVRNSSDTENTEFSNLKVQKIHFDDIKNVAQLKKELKMDRITTGKSNSELNLVPFGETGFLMDATQAALIEYQEDEYYTISLFDPDDPSRVVNLLLSPQDESYKKDLIEYDLSPEERKRLTQNQPVDLAGKMGFLGSLDDSSSDNPSITTMSSPCVEVIYQEEQPCAGNQGHPYGAPCPMKGGDRATPGVWIIDLTGCGGGGPGGSPGNPGDGGDPGNPSNPGDGGFPGNPGDGGNPGGGGGSGNPGGLEPDGLPTTPVVKPDFYYDLDFGVQQYWDNEIDSDVKNEVLNYIEENGSEENIQIVNRYIQLHKDIDANPNYLLDNFSYNNGNYDDWLSLVQYEFPNSVSNKIESLKQNKDKNWDLQLIENAGGANVNMDYFSVNITQLPKKPFSNEQYTPEELLEHFRKNINNFTKNENGNHLAEFEPSTVTGYNESIIWDKSNPLRAILHIDIPGNDGSVICSKFDDAEWYFTTLTTPFLSGDHYDGTHPVSGNRAFGIETNANGTYTLYTRGVDRVRYRLAEIFGNLMPGWDSVFQPSDDLWSNVQLKLAQFINTFDGSASVNETDPIRVDVSEINDYILNGE